jgi:hypothetical protein
VQVDKFGKGLQDVRNPNGLSMKPLGLTGLSKIDSQSEYELVKMIVDSYIIHRSEET